MLKKIKHYKRVSVFRKAILQGLTLILLSNSFVVQSQNLNNPNKVGPLGIQVNTLSGNVFIPRTDFKIAARKMDLDVSFYYNSYFFNKDFGYGKGWTFEYNIKYRNDTNGIRHIMWGDGREDQYDSIPGGGYKTPRGFFNTLTQYQPGKYVLTQKNGDKYFFDNDIHKHITKIEEPNGNYLQFGYTDSLLTSIANAAGQTISLTYNSQGRIASVIDAMASPTRTFTYSYSTGGQLLQVTDPLNGKMKYTYLVNGPMKSMEDKNQNKVDLIYFNDFSARELVGCNKRISFSYDTANQVTNVVDHLPTGNQVTKYKYKSLDNLSWIVSRSGNCCGYNVSFDYDDQGNAIKKTDANGQVFTYTYDSSGNMLTAADPLGNISTYTYTNDFNKINSYKDPKGNIYTLSYDSKGNLTQLVAPGNNVYAATYNAQGDIISSTDPKGNIYNYNYDAYGNPTTVTGPNGYQATLSFDIRGHLLAYTDARGNNTVAEYDILSRLKKITDPYNNNIQLSYDANDNLVTVKSKKNETTTAGFDASNRIVSLTGATGNTSYFSYDGMDNLLSVKNPLGYETKMSYDKLNRMNGAKDADDNNTTYSYDGNGNIISAVLANGNVISYSYDGLNRVISKSDASGIIASFEYDKNGNVLRYTNGTGAVTTYAYDQLNRLISITDPLGNSNHYAYDKNNNLISFIDREGHTQSYTYDNRNRVITHTDNNGFVTTIGYDAMDNITSLTDQNGNVTTYTYDNLNRRQRMTFPDASYKEFGYDANSNVISIRQTDGSVISYTYDSLNRITSRTLPGGEVYSFTYDKLNRVLTATNNIGTVTFTYDKLNRITSETFDGRTTSYQYNVAGRKQTTIYPDSTVVVKEYDSRNRLLRILKDSVLVVAYTYNNANQLTQKHFSNNINSTLQYDFANRLSSINTANGSLQNTQFLYNKDYHKTAINRLNNPSLSEQFTYDNGYRLTNYKRGPSGSPVIENSYTYDAVGNRTAANLNGSAKTYTVNNLNQMTGVNSTAFTYDSRGNITYDGNFYKTYDIENKLVIDSASPALVIKYGYDAIGRRVTKTVNGVLYKYTYSGAAPIEERDASNGLLNRTVFRNFLSPVMNENNGNKYFYHANEMNSVEAITNEAGRVVENYRYDVYGKLSRYDSLNNPLSATITGNRFGFTGQEYDSISNSYCFFFRNYNPETGTFNQRDLIEYRDGMGMYQYVGNNPANGIDVWGLMGMLEPPPIPPKPPNLPPSDDCTKKMSALEGWDLFSDSKSYIQATTTVDIFDYVPKGVSTPINIVSPYIDLYKTSQSINSASNSNSVTEQNMHAGDAIKNGTNATVGFVGLAATAAGATAVASGAGAVGLTIFVVDKASGKVFEMTITDEMDQQTFFNDLDTREYMWKQGRTDEEKVERIMKLDQLERMKRVRDYLNKLDCPPDGGPKVKFRLQWDPVRKMWVLIPFDPNLITGPDGQPDKAWVSVNDRLPYTIEFENDSSATARARYVKITSPIEPKQDPTTLELGSFGFNNQSFDIPVGSAFYTNRLDTRDSTGVFVDITAGYDIVKHQIFWEFQAIDPVTLLPPEDPLAGFLFVKDSLQDLYGKGFVNFSIKPRSDAQTLDTIGARAFIVFDENDTIPTNIHKNTIDAVAPTSQVNTLTAMGTSPINLSWTGSDDPNGSGIDYYTVYVTNDNVNYSVLFPKVYGTDTTFSLPPGVTYCFFVLATDRTGNAETLRTGVTTCTTIGNPLPVSLLYFTGTNVNKDNLLKWATSSEQNSKEFRLERSLNGTDFTQIAVVQAAGNSTSQRAYNYTDRNIDLLNSTVMFYRLKQVDNDLNFKYSNIVRLNYLSGGGKPSIVYPNPTGGTITILIGDNKLIGTEASVSDINGRLLKKFKITATSQSIDLSTYVGGVYFIRLQNKETLKIVKQ